MDAPTGATEGFDNDRREPGGFRRDVCVLCFLPIHSGHQWTNQPGPHRRKVTQDF